MNQPVPPWLPEKLSSTLMAKFISSYKDINCFSTTRELHSWFISNIGDFWSMVWDFFDLLGYKGVRNFIPSTLPESKFFPDAKISLAENLLRHDAEIIVTEERDLTNKGIKYSHKDLLQSVSNVSLFLQTMEFKSLIELFPSFLSVLKHCHLLWPDLQLVQLYPALHLNFLMTQSSLVLVNWNQKF